MPSHILAKASAAAVVASLALATGAQAHSSDRYIRSAANVEYKLDARYGDENYCITRDARNDRGRDSHFFCSDDSGRRFTAHVVGVYGIKLTRGWR